MGERLCSKCKTNPRPYPTSPWCGKCLLENTRKYQKRKQEARPPKRCECGAVIENRKRDRCDTCRAPKPSLVPITCSGCGIVEIGPRNKVLCRQCRREQERLCQAKREEQRTARRRATKLCPCGALAAMTGKKLGRYCLPCREKAAEEERREHNARHYNKRRAMKHQARRGPVSIRTLWHAFGGLCPLCGVEVTRVNGHVDHIIPLAKGGAHSQENLQILCGPCNRQKGASA